MAQQLKVVQLDKQWAIIPKKYVSSISLYGQGMSNNSKKLVSSKSFYDPMVSISKPKNG